jgi:hypothetical protein
MNPNPQSIISTSQSTNTAKSHPGSVAPSLTTTAKATESPRKARMTRRDALTWLESPGHATAFTGKLTVIVSDLGDRRTYTIAGPGGLHIVGRSSKEWDESQARDAGKARPTGAHADPGALLMKIR